MKSKLVLLLLFSSVLTLTSCTLVKEKVYPFVDEAAVRNMSNVQGTLFPPI